MDSLIFNAAARQAKDAVVGDNTTHKKAGPKSYEVNFDVVNTTNSDIVIVQRDNVKVPIAKRKERDIDTGIYIRFEYKMSKEVLDTIRDRNNNGEGGTSLQDKLLQEAMNPVNVKQAHNRYVGRVEYRLNKSDICSETGSIYLDNLDLVVSTLPIGEVPNHPYADDEARKRLVKADLSDKPKHAFVNTIRVVDNDGLLGEDQFINMDGSVFRIPVIRDDKLKSGVYLNGDQPVINGRKRSKQFGVTIPIEDCLPSSKNEDRRITLYPSYSEAFSLGDNLDQLNKRLKEASAELELEKLNLAKDTAKLAQEQTEFKAEMERRKSEWDEKVRLAAYELDETKKHKQRMHELDMSEKRNQHEEKMQKKKSTFELFKAIPVVLTSALAIYTFAGKLRESSN